LPGQLYDLNSKYGSPEELKACCAALKAVGVRPIADVVINHRCADAQDDEGRWNLYGDTRADGSATLDEGDETASDGGRRPGSRSRKRIDWGRWAVAGDDPKFGGRGNADSGADFDGAPDLDHHNPELRDALVEWLVWLREECGFEGWRLDFAKGYAAKYSGEYIRRTLPRRITDGSTENNDPFPFCVGELWCDLAWSDGGKPCEDQNAARQALCDWVDSVRKEGGGDAAAFDFVAKGVVQAALASGELWRLNDDQNKPPGMSGWWPQRAVLFLENHDTGSAQQHWPCPPQCLQAAHAYILMHPGIPCLFAEHLFDSAFHAGPAIQEVDGEALRKAIDALLAARRDCGIDADSGLEILAAEENFYVADVQGRLGTARVKLGERMEMGDLLPAAEEGEERGGWRLAASGEGFAVWTRTRA
jgi:alpha-amylase